MHDLLTWLRLLKLLAVGAFTAGCLGVLVAKHHSEKRRFAFGLAAPGFGLTWAAGFLLTGTRGHSFVATWVLASLVSSLLALHGVLYLAGREGRDSPRGAALLVGSLVATYVLMVLRPT